MALDENIKGFIMHIASLSLNAEISIHSDWKTQIVLLLNKKVIIPAEYSDFINVFLEKLAVKLFKYTNINKHIINLEPGKQSPYGPINSPRLIELKILRIFIKTNLANDFICLFKSLAGAFILFVQKLDGSFHLYMDYQRLNNLTTKNQYLLLLIGELLNQLGPAK